VAYHRLHLAINLVVQSGVFIEGFLLLALQMTFGGTANPSRWSVVSELACDLANDLLRNPGWDPDKHKSPHQDLIGDAVEFEPNDCVAPWRQRDGVFLSIVTATRIRQSRSSHQRTEGLDSPKPARHGTAQ
jgi:hypothetical protein